MPSGKDGPSDRAADATRLLWAPPPAARRGPRPAVDLASVTRAGIEIADIEGLVAVTMQRVADALGFTKMALYRYVSGKVALVALMTDTALGEPPRLDRTPGGWRPRMHAWSRELFDRFERHPWTLETTVGVRVMGPHELGWLEQALATLTGMRLTGAEMLDVAVTLLGHVRTIAAQAAAAGGDDPEHSIDATLRHLVHGREESFPALAAVLDSVTRSSQDQALEFGLARILDGVELLVTSRRDHG